MQTKEGVMNRVVIVLLAMAGVWYGFRTYAKPDQLQAINATLSKAPFLGSPATSSSKEDNSWREPGTERDYSWHTREERQQEAADEARREKAMPLKDRAILSEY